MLQEKAFYTGIVTLNYAEGPSSGPPLVLIHGGGDRWQMFQPLLPTLTRRWHVYAPDMRGHGKSGRVPRGYRPEDYVQDITAFVTRQLDSPAILFGHSLGGWVALLTAAQLGDRVRALVLGDPPLNLERFVAVESSETRVAMWRALRDLGEAGLSSSEWAIALAEMSGTDVVDQLGWAESLSQADPDALFYHVTGRIDEYVQNVDVDGALRQLTCPVLLIQADPAHGAMVTDEDAEHVLTLLANGRHVRLDGSGHNLGLDTAQVSLLLGALVEFLEST
jgi:pimeloyl-ACP methyl ester carboxylesterase